MAYEIKTITATTNRIDQISVHAFRDVVQTFFPRTRWKTKLVGVRNAGDKAWVKPKHFAHGPLCVRQVHAAYRAGFVELQIKARRIDTYA
jgi:hypothetical protein